jgi:hypothetical protein
MTLPSQNPAKKVAAKVDGTKATKAPAKGAAAKPRSASTLRHLMKDLDKDIIRLGKKRTAIEATMAEKAGQVDHTELGELGRQHAEIVESLDRAEELWLALAEEAEAGTAGAPSQHR